jgi:hypothetical protein
MHKVLIENEKQIEEFFHSSEILQRIHERGARETLRR